MGILMLDIKNYLRGQRIEMEKLVDEQLKLKDELDDPKIAQDYKQNTIIPKLGELRHQISEKKHYALQEVKKMTDGAKQNIQALNNIKGEDLTDDAKLFSCGVKLTNRDLEQIIDRNSKNPTMIQLALRYADENGIKVDRVLDTHSAALSACDDLYSTAHLYVDHWIDHPEKSITILDQFFDEGRLFE